MNTFHLRIVTMDGKVFDDQASQIFLRTIDGDVAIRAGHINYCSGIGMGQAHVTLADGHERYAACIGGMVSMLNGECQVAATTWEWKEEIDEERAKKAKERAGNLGEALCKVYTGGSIHYRISASIGLAACNGGDGNTYSSLFEKADHAMYRTKQGGKNGYEIAGAKDVGMIRNGIKNIERRENMGAEDREFLAFSISLMAHAKNIDGSLNMLLNRITERYQLDLVMVFEDNTENDGMVMTNYFGNNFSFYGKSAFPKKSPSLKELQPGEYMIVKNSRSNFATGMGNYLKSTDTYNEKAPFSAVVGKFEYVGGCTGEVIYVSLDEERQWQPGELEIFQELTRMMAIFVSLRYRVEESREQISSIQKKVEKQD